MSLELSRKEGGTYRALLHISDTNKQISQFVYTVFTGHVYVVADNWISFHRVQDSMMIVCLCYLHFACLY